MTGRKITDALLYVGKAQRLPRDSNGFVFFDELRPFLDDVMRNAAEIKEETPGKLDSPIEVVFPDGSKARLINPNQHWFSFGIMTYFANEYYSG